MMRILHITNYFQPVMGYQETFLAKHQIENGHDVLVVTSDRYASVLYRGGASRDILGNRIRSPGPAIEEGIPVLRLPTRVEFHNNLYVSGLKKAVMDFSPDVIHLHNVATWHTLRVCLMRRRLREAVIVVDDHKTHSPGARHVWIRWLYYAMFRLMFSRRISRCTDHFVAVTDETREHMIRLYGLPPDEISIIPLGCDSTMFQRDLRTRKELRAELGIDDDQVVFCYVGKITPEKGASILVKAALSLLKEENDVAFLFVGGQDREYIAGLRTLIGESPQGKNRFVFLPPVPNNELARYYSVADVGVWPMQCSLTMIEAMACGLPIIISDASGANERVNGNLTGLTYHESDTEDLKRKMKILLEPSKRQEMAENSRRIAESWDWRGIDRQFEELYKKKDTDRGQHSSERES